MLSLLAFTIMHRKRICRHFVLFVAVDENSSSWLRHSIIRCVQDSPVDRIADASECLQDYFQTVFSFCCFHRFHSRHVFHDKMIRLDKLYEPYEMDGEAVSWVFRVTLSWSAEALTWRPSDNQEDMALFSFGCDYLVVSDFYDVSSDKLAASEPVIRGVQFVCLKCPFVPFNMTDNIKRRRKA